MAIQDVGDSYQKEDQHLPADAPKPYVAGQRLIRNGAHHTGQIIHHYKKHQGDQQPVIPAKEIPQPSAYSGKCHLDHVPKFFHYKYLAFIP